MSTAVKNPVREVTSSGRLRQKARTRRLLIETAAGLIAAGKRPTVTDVADAADVSRRTAYRYFPTQEKLHTEAALEGLRPSMEAAIESSAPSTHGGHVAERLQALVDTMQQLAIKNEALLRTMIHETILEATPKGTPRRGTRRIDWIQTAVKPLQEKLSPASYGRLVSALALCTGIEALLVLRDICALSAEEAVDVSQWMASAVLAQSLREQKATQRKSR